MYFTDIFYDPIQHNGDVSPENYVTFFDDPMIMMLEAQDMCI